MDIQQIIPRNKCVRGRRPNYYVDLSRVATERESLVQLLDHQKDLQSLQDGQRQAFIHGLEGSKGTQAASWGEWHPEGWGRMDTDTQLCFPSEVNGYDIIRLREKLVSLWDHLCYFISRDRSVCSTITVTAAEDWSIACGLVQLSASLPDRHMWHGTSPRKGLAKPGANSWKVQLSCRGQCKSLIQTLYA